MYPHIATKPRRLYVIAGVLTFLFFLGCTRSAEDSWIIEAPADQAYTEINMVGRTVLPNGRFIKPYGKTVQIAPHPFGLVLSPDGKTAVTANSGISPISISILSALDTDNPTIRQVPEGAKTDHGVLSSVFMGLAIPPSGDRVYVAGGKTNCVFTFDLKTGAKLDSIPCTSSDTESGYIGDLVLDKSGSRLYAVDQINFQLLCIDPVLRKVLYRVPTGRYPFGVTLSPDGKSAYVANVGMYAYRWIPGFDPKRPAETAVQQLPFPYLSKASETGIENDSLRIPGLGAPNTPESFSVWKIDLATQSVRTKTKTGVLVGEVLEDIPAVGGASPNSVVATDRYVFVSNGNNDNISVISTEKDTVIATIPLQPDKRLKNWRGIIPFGLALSPNQKRLFVAEAGLNAVAVVDVEKLQVVGHIPVGWFPSKLQVTPDGKRLIVANAKGFGSGPNGGPNFSPGKEGSYIGNLMKGSVTILDIPDDTKLQVLTQEVIQNNFRFSLPSDARFATRKQNPVPLFPGASESPIKYLVFVSKENRTYDEVFGQLAGGRGASELSRFGASRAIRSRDGKRQLDRVDVMPNHLALAQRYAFSDNFYVDSDVSADGHRWLACTYPNEWVETSVTASYGGNQNNIYGSNAPGVLAFVGASGAIYPEDYNEAGSMWDHLDRRGKKFWNFGFGTMFSPHLSDDLAYPKGYAYAINYPVTQALYKQTSREYPTYNTAIPDQYRIDRFITEFERRWITGKEAFPSMLTVLIGNDHGAGDRPNAGYPFLESYMADNDLALGRLVEFLSKTPYWKNMAIVVTEDDAQGGVDHVDAHRSILMVISPFAKSGHISHTHTSFGSIFKTFWNILGIPYLNQYDAGASDLSDLFHPVADFRPYKAVLPDPRLFDPQKAYSPLDKRFDWRALKESPKLDDVEYIVEEFER